MTCQTNSFIKLCLTNLSQRLYKKVLSCSVQGPLTNLTTTHTSTMAPCASSGCLNQVPPRHNLCAMHACSINGCRDESKPWYKFCDNHRCDWQDMLGERNCGLARAASGQNGDNHCEGSHKCNWIPGCAKYNNYALDSFCVDHKCAANCGHAVTGRANSIYCAFHECKIPDCRQKATPSSGYMRCDEHKS